MKSLHAKHFLYLSAISSTHPHPGGCYDVSILRQELLHGRFFHLRRRYDLYLPVPHGKLQQINIRDIIVIQIDDRQTALPAIYSQTCKSYSFTLLKSLRILPAKTERKHNLHHQNRAQHKAVFPKPLPDTDAPCQNAHKHDSEKKRFRKLRADIIIPVI